MRTQELLTFEQINSTISGRYGKFYLTCPLCSASRSKPNRKKRYFASGAIRPILSISTASIAAKAGRSAPEKARQSTWPKSGK